MNPLQCVLERWPVSFSEDVSTNLYEIRGRDTNDERVESSVVDGAHRNAVWNHRLAAVGILLDVCSIQEFRMAEAAQGALSSVRCEHSAPEVGLMHPTTDHAEGVLTATNLIRPG